MDPDRHGSTAFVDHTTGHEWIVINEQQGGLNVWALDITPLLSPAANASAGSKAADTAAKWIQLPRLPSQMYATDARYAPFETL
jgi:hypothetical protein